MVAENQPEYLPVCVAVYDHGDGSGSLLTRWTLTDEERQRVAAGEDIYHRAAQLRRADDTARRELRGPDTMRSTEEQVRISVDNPIIGARVTLDGAEIKYVVMADDAEGVVQYYPPGPDGRSVKPLGEPLEARGAVVITLPPHRVGRVEPADPFMLDELRKLLEITGASGVAAAMTRVEGWKTSAEIWQQHIAREHSVFYEQIRVVMDESLAFNQSVVLNAMFAIMHEYERVCAIAALSPGDRAAAGLQEAPHG
ncbi:MAG TPA: hypothetical protein VFN76_09905 [Candidatus Limnocylindria bacterium]|nr:hypothetical protein [Candidatus Limnocylindria bacterium]